MLLGLATAIVPQSPQEPASPFDFFEHQCLAANQDFSATTELAAKIGWPSLSEEVLRIFAPVAGATSVRGWIVSNDEDDLKILVVSHSIMESQVIDTCTVGLSNVDTKGFEDAVSGRFGAPAESEDQGPDRVNERFHASYFGRKLLLTVSIPRFNTGPGQIVASAIAGLR